MKVGIIMGSKSDLDTMKKASAILDEFNIPYEMVIASALVHQRLLSPLWSV